MRLMLTLFLILPLLSCLAQTPPPAPPVRDSGTLQRDALHDSIYTKVEIESEFPGGKASWEGYLDRHFRYPRNARKDNIQGTVVVQFIVDKEGVVSDVQAISGPEELRQEAVRLINGSGKWTPAVQNGRQVKYYKKKPIEFKLDPA